MGMTSDSYCSIDWGGNLAQPKQLLRQVCCGEEGWLQPMMWGQPAALAAPHWSTRIQPANQKLKMRRVWPMREATVPSRLRMVTCRLVFLLDSLTKLPLLVDLHRQTSMLWIEVDISIPSNTLEFCTHLPTFSSPALKWWKYLEEASESQQHPLF